MAQWNIFAYTRPVGEWRLGENGKRDFSIYITVLARLMQAELGFRELISDPEMIVCPNCGTKHDVYQICQCGWTYSKTFDEIYRKIHEEQMTHKITADGEKDVKQET